jgi:hypothetical protein
VQMSRPGKSLAQILKIFDGFESRQWPDKIEKVGPDETKMAFRPAI